MRGLWRGEAKGGERMEGRSQRTPSGRLVSKGR